MKTILLLPVLLVFNLFSLQGQIKLKFHYDDAGNQIQREICVTCPSKNQNPNQPYPTENTITENDLIQDALNEGISYFPNPVLEELYVKWVNDDKKYVVSIELYSMTGQLMQKYSYTKVEQNAAIAFRPYPTGFYNLLLIYSNGQKTDLKIIKK